MEWDLLFLFLIFRSGHKLTVSILPSSALFVHSFFPSPPWTAQCLYDIMITRSSDVIKGVLPYDVRPTYRPGGRPAAGRLPFCLLLRHSCTILPLRCACTLAHHRRGKGPRCAQYIYSHRLDGNEIDQSILADSDLTMVNVWGTFCPPCRAEMPDLAALHEEYADQGVQIVGIVSDVLNQDGTLNEDQVEEARTIAQDAGVSYTNLLPSKSLYPVLGQMYCPALHLLRGQ